MAAYDWSLPLTSTNYLTFVTELHNRLNEVAKGFPTADTYSNLVSGAMSFRNNKWQTWDGTTWADSAATYAISISGTAGNVTGTVAAAKGGTGNTTYTIGDLLYASAATTLSKRAAVAAGSVLISAGVATAPVWGKVDLNTHTNTTALPVSKGGLGVTTGITGVVVGNGTSYAAGTAGVDFAAASHTHNYLDASGGTITGNLSIINGVLERTITLGSSGAYVFGNPTSIGFNKSGGGSFTILVASGNTTCSGTLTSGGKLTVNTGGATITTGNLVVSAGNITASGTILTSSDRRLKTEIRTLSNALERVKALRGVSYLKLGVPEIGLIAQEVEEQLPELVGNIGEYKSVAYGNIVALLIEAIKELEAKVNMNEKA